VSAAANMAPSAAPLTLAAFVVRVDRVGNGPEAAAVWIKYGRHLALADRVPAWCALLARTAEVMRGHRDLTRGLGQWLRARCALVEAERLAHEAARGRRTVQIVRDVAPEPADGAAVDAEGERIQTRILDMERAEDLAGVVAAIEASALPRGFKVALARAAREHAAKLARSGADE